MNKVSREEIIKQGREAAFRFYDGKKFWVSYGTYIHDDNLNIYLPVDEGTKLFQGIQKQALKSVRIELLDNDTGAVVAETELTGKLVLLTDKRESVLADFQKNTALPLVKS